MNRPQLRTGLRTTNAIYSTTIFHQALNLCLAFNLSLPHELNEDIKNFLKGFDYEKRQAIYQYAASMLNKRNKPTYESFEQTDQ